MTRSPIPDLLATAIDQSYVWIPLDPGETPQRLRAKIQKASRKMGARFKTAMDGGKLYVTHSPEVFDPGSDVGFAQQVYRCMRETVDRGRTIYVRDWGVNPGGMTVQKAVNRSKRHFPGYNIYTAVYGNTGLRLFGCVKK